MIRYGDTGIPSDIYVAVFWKQCSYLDVKCLIRVHTRFDELAVARTFQEFAEEHATRILQDI